MKITKRREGGNNGERTERVSGNERVKGLHL